MKLKIYYKITKDNLGRDVDYSGARYIDDNQLEAAEAMIAADYHISTDAVSIEHVSEVL